ncbi:SpoIIE family protein phosphatase [Telmatospirillum sp. J64-1]|uniref:SpoIIE family protein phosphatase n=1 Tax=Telmatospirillum sp. J64-1 TaxID=2502183 RepID=UPI00115E2B05|nr:SpoIIE family protein phosphatase [Telmatospirillum sp. J64-1]
MFLYSIKTKIFLAVTLILAAVAGFVMTSSRFTVETEVVEAERRSGENILSLVEDNIRGRYRTLLKDKVATIQSYKEQFRDFDRVVLNTLERFAQLADQGLVTEDEARAMALRWLSETRPASGDYLIAFDSDNRAIVSPDPARLNTDISAFLDVKGRSVAAAARDETERYGDTFLTYHWPAYGEDRTEAKFGHFVLFRRWGWVIGSVGDVARVEAEVGRKLYQLEVELGETLPSIQMAGRGSIFIFDSDGRMVIPPNPDSPGAGATAMLDDLATLARQGSRQENEVLPLTTPQGEALEARAIYIKPLDWYIASIVSRDAMRAPAEALVAGQARIFLAALAVGLLFAYLFAHRIALPLNRLTAYAKTLPETDFEAGSRAKEGTPDLPVGRKDELGRLAEAFVFMEESLLRNVRSLMNATAARQRIEGELTVARDIQMGLLPKVFPAYPDRPEIDLFSALESAKEVGGDLFDFYFLDENRLCFTIGDVAGKGVPAALFMAITKTLIKAASERDGDPARMLAKVNDDLSRDNPNSIFVTLVIGILDLRTGQVHYANGGHNPPMIRRQDGRIETLRDISGPAAGVFEDMDYSPLEVKLEPGDTLLLYTDGVTEAMNPANDLYGEERLVHLLEQRECADAEPLVAQIMEDIQIHADGAEQSDDITIMAIGFRGAAASVLVDGAKKEVTV